MSAGAQAAEASGSEEEASTAETNEIGEAQEEGKIASLVSPAIKHMLHAV